MPRLRSRNDDLVTTKVDLVEFTPDLMVFLGRAAYVQLTQFENLSRAISSAPTTSAKTAIGRAAELSLGKHRMLVEQISRAGGVPAEVMEPATADVDRFESAVKGADRLNWVGASHFWRRLCAPGQKRALSLLADRAFLT